jgi:hypothetical protein
LQSGSDKGRPGTGDATAADPGQGGGEQGVAEISTAGAAAATAGGDEGGGRDTSLGLSRSEELAKAKKAGWVVKEDAGQGGSGGRSVPASNVANVGSAGEETHESREQRSARGADVSASQTAGVSSTNIATYLSNELPTRKCK